MPGPVSDSYDPEWGTGSNRDKIAGALKTMHGVVGIILSNSPPVNVLDLVRPNALPQPITATLTEKQWRLIRFALERAKDSL
jgi:hypothetical protein